MDPVGVIVVCLLAAAALTAGVKSRKAKPFLAWVVELGPSKKKRRRRRRRK